MICIMKYPYPFSHLFFGLESQDTICQVIKPFYINLLPRLLNQDDSLASSKSGKGKEAAGREKKLAYLPFVEVMDNLTAQTFLTLPL